MNLQLRCKSLDRWSKQFDDERESNVKFESLRITKTHYPLEMEGFQLPLGATEEKKISIDILNSPLKDLQSDLAIDVITSAWRFNRICVNFDNKHTTNFISVQILRQWIGTPVYIPLERPGTFRKEKVDGFLCGVFPTLFDELWLVLRAITTSAKSIDFVIRINNPYFDFDNTKQIINQIKVDQGFNESESYLFYPIIQSLLTQSDKLTLWHKHQLRVCNESLIKCLEEIDYKKLKYYDIDECLDCFDEIPHDKVEINYPPTDIFPVNELVFNVDLNNKIETWVRQNNVFEEPKHYIPLTQLQWTTFSGTLMARMIMLRGITDTENILRLCGLHMYCLGATRTYDGVPVDVFIKMYAFYRGQEDWLNKHVRKEYKDYINFAQNKLLKYYKEKNSSI